MKTLALKTESLNEDMSLEIALNYSDYIFDKFENSTTFKQRIENFKNFVNKSSIYNFYLFRGF